MITTFNSLKQSFIEMFRIKDQGVIAAIEEEEEIELIKLNENCFTYYKKYFRGNEDISEDQANRKMTRNKRLSFVYKQDSTNKKYPRVYYAYGQMRFMVQNNEVKWIKHNCVKFPMWYKDWDEYDRLSTLLKIDEKYLNTAWRNQDLAKRNR